MEVVPKFKNARSYASNLLYVFLSSCLIKDRDLFTYTGIYTTIVQRGHIFKYNEIYIKSNSVCPEKQHVSQGLWTYDSFSTGSQPFPKTRGLLQSQSLSGMSKYLCKTDNSAT